MTGGSKAAGIVVTFHPDASVLANLAALRRQVETVVVVDNGSSTGTLAALRRAAGELDCVLLENGENLGIASALNRGIRHALEAGREWLFLFDQDSCVTEGFVTRMIAAYRQSRWGTRLGILVPRYVDRRFQSALPAKTIANGSLDAAMTSGSLLHRSTLAAHGLFVDELFIDGVDFEHSLRLRRAGLVIEECAEAQLLHSPGEPIFFSLFGRRLFQTANYSPVRRYYQERNKVWIGRRYGRAFPGFVLMLARFTLNEIIKITLAEQNRGQKLRAMAQGWRDGFRERMGRLNA